MFLPAAGRRSPLLRICGIAFWTVCACGGTWVVDALHAQGTSDKLNFKTGKDIYMAGCVACHGADGGGQSPSLQGFERPSTFPDFTSCRGSTPEPDVQWQAIITNGGPARGFSQIMPSFKGVLTQEQIKMVVQYLRSLCTNKSWPRGNLNLPRAFVTEKAFPEDEVVVQGGANTAGYPSGNVTAFYEKRLGSSDMIEAQVPYGWNNDGTGGTHSAFGDIALGYKRKLWSSLNTGSIVSAGAEVIAPTGSKTAGTGGESTTFELFGAWGQILPKDSFVQVHTGIELPVHPDVVPRAYYFHTAVGKTFAGGWMGLGRRWTPMNEFVVDRDLVTGAKTNFDVVPQIQIPISKRMHILADIGFQVPVNNTAGRSTQVLFYLLWDYADGSLRQGWK